MSLFDRRTDTERELDAYRQNNSSNERRNPFDTQNTANGNNNRTQSNPYDYGNTNYNNSINRQQNPFDTQNTANSSQNGVKPNTYGDNNINNIELNSNNNNNNGQSSCAMSILFLIWFVGSMIACAIFGGTGQTGLGLVMIGQVFLVMGIVVCSKIKKEKGKPIGMEFLLWLFPIVGAGTIIGGMINAFGDSLFIERFNKNVVPVAFCLIFVLVGLGVLIFPMVKRKKDRERCTVRIDADIINVKSTITVNNKNRRRRVYAPVYRYYYQGKVYENSSTLYTGYKITVNTKGEIYINPSDANDFIEPNRERYGLVVMNILGIVFTVMGLVAILTILFN